MCEQTEREIGQEPRQDVQGQDVDDLIFLHEQEWLASDR